MAAALQSFRLTLFLLLFFGFAVADLWYFKRLDAQTDLAILFAVAGGAGISVAHTAGVNSASTSAAPTVTVPTPVIAALPTPPVIN